MILKIISWPVATHACAAVEVSIMSTVSSGSKNRMCNRWKDIFMSQRKIKKTAYLN